MIVEFSGFERRGGLRVDKGEWKRGVGGTGQGKVGTSKLFLSRAR